MNPESEIQRLTFDVFGRIMTVVRSGGLWLLFSVSEHGMLSWITDVAIPAEITESEVLSFLDDSFHESVTIDNPVIRKLD